MEGAISGVEGGNNMNITKRLYEKDYLLEFHKGFILNTEQYHNVTRLLEAFDFDGIEAFLREHFPQDVNIVKSMLDHQRQLRDKGYYNE